MSDPFWCRWYDWFLITDHPWDLRLQMEAMSMGVAGVAREIGEVLLSAFQRTAAAISAFALTFEELSR